MRYFLLKHFEFCVDTVAQKVVRAVLITLTLVGSKRDVHTLSSRIRHSFTSIAIPTPPYDFCFYMATTYK